MDTRILIPTKQYEKVCNEFNYFKAIIIELSESYEKQTEHIEEFALWNLPTEIASSWDNIEYFIKRLLKFKVITDNDVNILNQIVGNFNDVSFEGKNFNADVWTHEALKNSSFWRKQRELANIILNNISSILLVKD